MNNKVIAPDRRDLFLAIGMVLCGFLFWEAGLISYDTSIGKAVFALLICSITGVYLYSNGFKQSRDTLLVLVGMILLGATFIIFSGRIEHAITLPVLAAMYLYWVALTCKGAMDDKLSIYVFGDILKQSCAIPFINYETCPKVLASSSRGKGGKNVLLVLVGLVIAVPLAIVAMTLLSQADQSFNDLISNVIDQISWKWLEYLGELIIGVPVAFYLFGQAYGNTKGDRLESMNKKSVSRFVRAFAKFPPLIGTTILSCLNLIYLVFLGLQIVHVVQGLPKNMSYSEFARQGFFQLCDVVVLNLVLVVVIGLLYKRKGRAKKYIRIQIGLMSLLTIGITVTALAKMLMYINVFGLTQKRIYTSVFMLFLIIVFLSLCIFQFKRFNIGRVMCIAGLVLLLLMNYAGVDRTIAKYNIYRYEKGTLPMMDKNLMCSLGDGAIPELYKLYKKTANVDIALALREIPANNSWAAWSIEREMANKARERV